MKVRVPGSVCTPAIRPQPVGPGRLRKIGIIGGSPESLAYVPWADPTWEFWTHSSCVLAIPYLRADRIFDVHPDHCFTEARKNGFKDYYGFLRGCPTPIYMHRKVEEIPQSVVYTYRLLKQFWPGVPFGSQTAFMVALALYEGVTHLGFWGVSYAHETEYARQRSNAEQWVGIARGQGVQIVLPPNTPFCREPYEDYAYESHNTPEKYAALKAEMVRVKAEKAQVAGVGAATRRLIPMDTPEASAQAAQIRAEKQAVWSAEVAKFGPDEVFPSWIVEKEKVEREEALASRHFVGALRAEDGSLAPVPRGTGPDPAQPAARELPAPVSRGRGAKPQAPAGARAGKPAARRRRAGAGTGAGDRPVQRGVRAAGTTRPARRRA